jgi:hypothetical protein
VSGTLLPLWVYLAVALAIALVAFGLAQLHPGAGMPFVIVATTVWTAYVASRRWKK